LYIKFLCPVCESKNVLELIPDYVDLPFWCANPKCGAPVNREDLPKLKDEIINLANIWNQFWINQSSNPTMESEEFERVFLNVGTHLADEIGRKYECKFDPDKATVYYGE
jgi:hypothetical protein